MYQKRKNVTLIHIFYLSVLPQRASFSHVGTQILSFFEATIFQTTAMFGRNNHMHRILTIFGAFGTIQGGPKKTTPNFDGHFDFIFPDKI